MLGRGVCMVGGMHGRRVHAWWGACMAGQTATAAYGMHPNGMHSCVKEQYVCVICIVNYYLEGNYVLWKVYCSPS